jgi:hypothetical protein
MQTTEPALTFVNGQTSGPAQQPSTTGREFVGFFTLRTD